MKSNINENVICPNCGHVYEGHTNVYGKVCMHCIYFIPPQRTDLSRLSTTQRIHRQRKQKTDDELKEKAIQSILKRELEEKNYEHQS